MAPTDANKIYDTPRKARVKGAVEFNDWAGIPYFKADIFQFNGVSKRRG